MQPDSGGRTDSRLAGEERIRIAFVVNELTTGGAEMMLWKLLSRLDRSRFETLLIALSPRTDSLHERFLRSNIACAFVDMTPGPRAFTGLWRLRRKLRDFRPHIVQGWLYHANLAATLVNALVPASTPVLWSVRGTLIDRRDQKRLSAFTVWLGGKLSFMPARIVSNSLAAALEHEALYGYSSERRVVVPNGFDTGEFRPSPSARARLRAELGLAPDALLIGLAARYHPMKDHDNFLRAASLLEGPEGTAHYVLAGEDIDSENRELAAMIGRHGLEGRVHLLGIRTDMPMVTAALDVAVSASSSGEGFPNVIGEAMSCAIPCVATNVGDSAIVIGETGRVVPPRDPVLLAAAIRELVALPVAGRRELGRLARERVIENYSLDAVVSQYADIYRDVHERAACTHGA